MVIISESFESWTAAPEDACDAETRCENAQIQIKLSFSFQETKKCLGKNVLHFFSTYSPLSEKANAACHPFW